MKAVAGHRSRKAAVSALLAEGLDRHSISMRLGVDREVVREALKSLARDGVDVARGEAGRPRGGLSKLQQLQHKGGASKAQMASVRSAKPIKFGEGHALPVSTPPVVPKRLAFDPLPGIEPVGLLDLAAHHCRWPVGERAFCGEYVEGATARRPGYCPVHHRLSRSTEGACQHG